MLYTNGTALKSSWNSGRFPVVQAYILQATVPSSIPGTFTDCLHHNIGFILFPHNIEHFLDFSVNELDAVR